MKKIILMYSFILLFACFGTPFLSYFTMDFSFNTIFYFKSIIWLPNSILSILSSVFMDIHQFFTTLVFAIMAGWILCNGQKKQHIICLVFLCNVIPSVVYFIPIAYGKDFLFLLGMFFAYAVNFIFAYFGVSIGCYRRGRKFAKRDNEGLMGG